jgi:sigma-B regulation protein RsbQ
MSTTPSPSRDWVLARHHVNVSGDRGPAMIFAHGFGCDQNMWRFVAPAFTRDYRVVLFDYVGCGRSDRASFDAARYATLGAHAGDLLEICAALELQDAIFVGHSVSAMIGVLAARREPDRFSRLLMIGPSPRYLDDPPDYHGGFARRDIDELLEVMDHNYLGWAHGLAPVVMGNADRPELTSELEQSFCSTDPVAARTFARATFLADNRADLPHVTVPSLILQVSDDAIAPMSVGRYLQAHLPGSQLTVLDASGHCPHVSHPEDTVRAMQAYLEQRVA